MLPTLGSGVLIDQCFSRQKHTGLQRMHQQAMAIHVVGCAVLRASLTQSYWLPGAGAHPEKMQRAVWIHIDAARDIQAAKGCER